MAGEGYKVNGLRNWYHFNNRQLTKYDSKWRPYYKPTLVWCIIGNATSHTFFYLGSLLESNQRGRMAPLRVGILYFSSVLFSILAISYIDGYDKEIDGGSAGVYGLIGGHIGTGVLF